MMNMPPVTKNLIIINLLFFLAKLVAVRYGMDLDNLLGLNFFLAPDFRLYQFFTYMFMHGGFEHILFNMFAVWMFGRVMESYWGGRRFLLYYMVCGVGAGLVQEGVQYVSYLWQGLSAYETVNIGYSVMSMSEYLNSWTTVGASGAVYGILLAFGMSFPNERLFIFPLPVPIKAKFFVIGYAVIELLSALGNSGDGVAHFAHLGGMIFGLLLILYWRKNNGGGYSNDRGSVSDKFKKWFSGRRDRFSSYEKPKMNATMGERKDDYEYNARKKAEAEDIDRILEKVRKSGYKSLTEEEKRKLFDASQR
ncbi:MAG: rhomboid family intramembrane serine protease [Paraprevotella sp.]|nr:rhomboid family intramembrane serine protease [Paraprevotella sp.]